MSNSPHTAFLIEPTTSRTEPCLDERDAESFPQNEPANTLSSDRLLAAQAMNLLIRLDRDLKEARAQFNQDWFRRIMRARPKAVSRLRRRWSKISPPPRLSLGSLRRRYHTHLGS
jgi:hypothetical protein